MATEFPKDFLEEKRQISKEELDTIFEKAGTPITDHYPKTDYEPIKIIQHYDLNFSLGNVIKYVLRAGKKEGNTKEADLKKAIDYLNFELNNLQDKK